MLKRKIVLILILIISMQSLFGCVNYEKEYYIESETIFQNSNIILGVKLLGKNAKAAYAEMSHELKLIDADISLTREESSLFYFNEKAQIDEKVKISKHAYNMIKAALFYEKETGGAFSITVPLLTKKWHLTISEINEFMKDGIVQSFVLPTYKEIQEVQEESHISNLTLYPSIGSDEPAENGDYFISKKSANFKIDLGAIAKGYCADLCKEIALKHEIKSGCIDISGNLIIINKAFDGVNYNDWRISVKNPRPINKFYICGVETGGDISIVTSGDYERYYYYDNKIDKFYANHIIDPRSGLPAGVEKSSSLTEFGNNYKMKSDSVSSATIFCKSSMQADVYATTVSVLGLVDGFEFLKDKEGVSAVIFSERNYDENNNLLSRFDKKTHNYMRVELGNIRYINENHVKDYLNYSLYKY